eukprot:TRINITY_DN11630_c0_g1_i1.p1 TRINITY_DN11630_c0_g1~~TRINITY_DN11630_c0_g1_i1.p1  ORF type:complete len:178 (+),score=50.50 TRINITY_DN11630_c0_g1_i1:107-640(+)
MAFPKRALRGIYAGKQIGYGNRVSHSEHKTRRRWLPNAVYHRMYSSILDEKVRIRMTTHAMRLMDKKGGLDSFLLFTKPKVLDRGLAQVMRQELTDILLERAEKGDSQSLETLRLMCSRRELHKQARRYVYQYEEDADDSTSTSSSTSTTSSSSATTVPTSSLSSTSSSSSSATTQA